MLHFSGGVAFRVDVGDFFEFKRAFERDGVVDAAAEVKKIGSGKIGGLEFRKSRSNRPAELVSIL